MRARARGILVAFGALVCGACELTEITLATPSDIIIAEIVLREGARLQTAWLYRTATDGTSSVRNAIIIVTDQVTGDEIVYSMATDSLCIAEPAPDTDERGTCYAAAGPSDMVQAGHTYSLIIETQDRRILNGTTRVPGDFQLVTPAATSCRLAPKTTLDLMWRGSANAAVYLSEARLLGLQAALRAGGAAVEGNGPIDLTGLAVTAADTSIVFPGEFGLFDRFDEELHEVLLAIRDGLPGNVRAEVMIAAADQNFVNWVRGSNFNPSGLVRISSIRGDGRGVFGSIVPRDFELRSTNAATLPRCDDSAAGG